MSTYPLMRFGYTPCGFDVADLACHVGRMASLLWRTVATLGESVGYLHRDRAAYHLTAAGAHP